MTCKYKHVERGRDGLRNEREGLVRRDVRRLMRTDVGGDVFDSAERRKRGRGVTVYDDYL